MIQQTILQTLFAAFALVLQTTLVLNFAARRWRPDLERQWGWLVYALGLPALAMGGVFWATGQPWYSWLAMLLFAAWAALGYTVDILRPINWRTPPRWPIFIPYITLYIAAQFALWIPLWFIWKGHWIIFAVLYTVSTILNVSSHFGGRKIQASLPG